MPAKLTLAIFIKKAKSIHKDKYEYDKVEYKNSYTKIKIYCKCCQNYFWQTPNKHLTGRGCPKCGNIQKGMVRRYSLIEFIKKVKDLYGNKYLICGKYKTNKTPIKVKCQVCKQIFYPTPNNLLRGSKCPCCKKVISKGEECIQKWLDLNKIKYIFQKKFVDCKDKRMLSFDFYLLDQNVCIEFQGQQHYKLSSYYSNSLKLKLQRKHDKIKKEYCKRNGIKLIEIKYNENIKEKLEKELENK